MFLTLRQSNLPWRFYRPNDLYDQTVSRLFKSRLHKDSAYTIMFAGRGSTDRTRALKKALAKAKENARKSWGVERNAPIVIKTVQVADYMLWALQRLYERREDRHIDYVWPVYSLVHAVDDTRTKKYGAFYTQKAPVSLAGLKPLQKHSEI